MNMQIGIFYHFGPENGLKGIVEYMGRSSFNGISLEITSTVIHLEFLEFLEFIVCYRDIFDRSVVQSVFLWNCIIVSQDLLVRV